MQYRWLWMAWALCLAACVGPEARVTAPARVGRLPPSERGTGGSTDLTQAHGPDLGGITERDRESEYRLALAQMWRGLEPIREVGADVEFVYWMHESALTLVSWRRVTEGGAPGHDADADAWAHGLRNLRLYFGEQTGYLRLLHRREQAAWSTRLMQVQLGSEKLRPPPEAKTLPVDVSEIAAGPFAALEREARDKWRLLARCPADGSATVEFTVDFEDDRLVGSSPGPYRAKGSGELVAPQAGFEVELAGALVGFTQGVGRRSVRVSLAATSGKGDAAPHWHVVKAVTLRPAEGEPRESFTLAADYRKLHEEILRRWRVEVRDAAAMAATFTGEQLAIWIVGGWVARGAGAVLEVAAGPVLRVLGRGGAEAAGWMESVLCRMPSAEREALARLWAKAEMEGLEALSAVERAELKAAIRRLDEIAATPIPRESKRLMWNITRRRFWSHLREVNPELAGRLKEYPIHHRLGLEYAHLAPEADANALSRLVAVHVDVHRKINGIWNTFRSSNVPRNIANIEEIMAIVDRNFGRWYNVEYQPLLEKAQLDAVASAAVKELEAFLLGKGVP